MPNRHLETVIENNIQVMININNLYLVINGYVKTVKNPPEDLLFIETAAKHTISNMQTAAANNICMTATESLPIPLTEKEKEALWDFVAKDLLDITKETTQYNQQLSVDLSQHIGAKIVEIYNDRKKEPERLHQGVDKIF